MPRATIQLHLPQPCAESWEAMTPAGPGRHCAACQRAVVDFTQKTDAELLAYLAGAGAAICGRLRPDQLSRPLHAVPPVSRWRAWLASGLALGGVLSASRTAAQTRSNYAGPLPEAVKAMDVPASAPAAAVRPAVPAAPVAAATSAPVLISGEVLDAKTSEKLPGVTVLVQGTTYGISTNANGRFSLETPDIPGQNNLVVSVIGYETQVVTVGSQTTLPLEVRLVAESRWMGEVVILYSPVPPAPWHPRALYYWGKYWLTRPFHR